MPGGLGGTHVGPEAMLTEVWRRPGAGSGSPVPERFLSCDRRTVVVTGTYVGQPPDLRRRSRPAFAHCSPCATARVRELRQITDTHPLGPAAAAADAEVSAGCLRRVEERDGAAVLDAYASDVVIREAPSLPLRRRLSRA